MHYYDKTHAPIGVDVNKMPCKAVSLDLTQEGDLLRGKYGASIDWGRRFETGEFSAKIIDNVAKAKSKSDWGGKLTVTMTLRGDKLYWKIIESEGENYFPNEMILKLVSRHNIGSMRTNDSIRGQTRTSGTNRISRVERTAAAKANERRIEISFGGR